MKKIGCFIKRDKLMKEGDLTKVSFEEVITVVKDGANYVVFKVNGTYMDTPYRNDYSKSKITSSQYKQLFEGVNARYISLEDAINDERTQMVCREYTRESNGGYEYNITTIEYMANGQPYKKIENSLKFYKDCVLVAILPDGRCIFDSTTQNYNSFLKSYSRIPALYMANEGYNPENNEYAHLGDFVEGYSKEQILGIYNNRPCSINTKGDAVEFEK